MPNEKPYTTELNILSDEQIAEIEAKDHAEMCGDALYCNCGKVTRDALCQTVRALQAENERLRKVVDIPPNERNVCDCYTWPTVSEMHDYTVALEARLSEVEKERDRLRESERQGRGIIRGWQKHIERMAKILKCEAMDVPVQQTAQRLVNFRTSVINLCNEKAAECESLMARTEGPAFEDIHAQAGAQIAIINELREAIENLGIATTEKGPSQ